MQELRLDETTDAQSDQAIFSMLREWYYNDSVASTVATWALTGFFWFAVAGSTDGSRFAVWAIALSGWSTLLLGLKRMSLDRDRWLRASFVFEALVGVLWGSIMLVAPPADPIDQMIVAVLLNAVVLASAIAMGQFFPLFLAFVTSTAFTALLGFWLNAPEVRVKVTIVLIGLLAYSSSVALQQSQTELRLARALRRNQRLADGLSGRNDALELANSQLDDLAHTDALTRLHNRFSFEKLLHTQMQQLMDSEVDGLRLAYLDIDRFKAVNDTLGHRAGDKVLQILARRLCGARVEGEFAARLGGDEMVLLAPGLDADELGSRLLKVLSEPIAIDGKPIDIGVSIGVAATTMPTDPDVLLRQADIALYDAKFAGGDRYAIAGRTEEPSAAPV